MSSAGWTMVVRVGFTYSESTAKIVGNVTTGTIAVVKGAGINGGVEIKSADA